MSISQLYIIAKETVVTLPDGSNKLGYTVLQGCPFYQNFEDAHQVLAVGKLPLGWVAMKVSQLFPGVASAPSSVPIEASTEPGPEAILEDIDDELRKSFETLTRQYCKGNFDLRRFRDDPDKYHTAKTQHQWEGFQLCATYRNEKRISDMRGQLTRCTNLTLDLDRLINGKDMICSFPQLQALKEKLDELANLRADIDHIKASYVDSLMSVTTQLLGGGEYRSVDDIWARADRIIEEAYPDTDNKGPGWWGAQRIPNFGILRGSIVGALIELQKKINGLIKPHPPSRHCKCVACTPSFEDTDELAQELDELAQDAMLVELATDGVREEERETMGIFLKLQGYPNLALQLFSTLSRPVDWERAKLITHGLVQQDTPPEPSMADAKCFTPGQQLRSLLKGLECDPILMMLGPDFMFALGSQIAAQAKEAPGAGTKPEGTTE